MAETPADVRRDIELTRERMSSTLDQLEQKLNVPQLVRENPWPALGLAVAAGFILSGSRADVRAAAATVAATRGASSRLGPVLDDLVSQVVSNVSNAFESRVTGWVDEIKGAIGAPEGQGGQSQRLGAGAQGQQGANRFADLSYGEAGGSVRDEGLVSRAGTAGIGGTPGGGFGTGPAHTSPNSFGNAAAGTNPTGPGATGNTGLGGPGNSGPRAD